jgi:hypothetical protein
MVRSCIGHESDGVVVTPNEVLKRLDARAVIASSKASDQDVYDMISELHLDECSHTWKWFNLAGEKGSLQKLLEFENKRRPTRLFFYYAEKLDGKRRFLGAGAIAEKIHQGFPHGAFPVVSRCYIMKSIRENRLYSSLLKHRVQACEVYYGKELLGIHLGTANPRVETAMRKGLLGAPFLFLGNENLGDAHSAMVVSAYLAPTANFAESLKIESKDDPKIYELVQTFIDGKNDSTLFCKLAQALSERKERQNVHTHPQSVLSKLLHLMSEIPLISTSVDAYPYKNLEINIRRTS